MIEKPLKLAVLNAEYYVNVIVLFVEFEIKQKSWEN